MPDWSYKPVFQPILSRIPPTVARDLTLNSLGILMRIPGGGLIIDFLGHTRTDPRLRQEFAGIHFPTRMGLGVGIDSNAVALAALVRMGLGFIEVGPVTLKAQAGDHTIQLRKAEEAIHYSPTFPTILSDQLRSRLEHKAARSLPLLIRLGYPEGASVAQCSAEGCTLIHHFAEVAAAFTLTATLLFLNGAWTKAEWQHYFHALADSYQQQERPLPLLLWLPVNAKHEQVMHLLDATREVTGQHAAKCLGVVIGGFVDTALAASSSPTDESKPRVWVGKDTHDMAQALIHAIRDQLASPWCIIASGGVHEPLQAMNLIQAGADLIQVDSGLVYSGPGLPKRINEALLYQAVQPISTIDEGQASQPTQETWFWTGLLGLGMIFGGCLAFVIAITHILLPYDESFVEMTSAELRAINPRLLSFMTHDRVTLAGVMVALGIFYSALSWFAIRRGYHWAKMALMTSAAVGFASFFFFLGFGYFDPFHAFVTVILFQFLLFGIYARLPAYTEIALPSWRNDWRWQRSLWGQLFFVVQGCAILGSGLVISLIGIRDVLVTDDLEYLQTTVDALQTANSRIIPLVAHDRATLGGMLLSSGVLILTIALWGYRPGARWLWWALVLGCTVAYACAITVHLVVGYIDWVHLAPAFAGAGLTIAGAWLSYPFLCGASLLIASKFHSCSEHPQMRI